MGSKIRSKMPEPGYSILVQKREFLCSDLVARHLVDILYSFHLLDDEDKDCIEKAESRSNREGVRKMLDILIYSGPSAYDKFLEALNEKGYGIAADELKATVVHTPPDPYAWIDDLPEEKKNYPLNERNLLQLSNYLAGGWESVMLNLGNTTAHNYHDKADNQFNSQMQIFSALNRWRQRLAGDATVIVLLRAMRSGGQIDWDGVKKYITESLSGEIL